jgi:tetratricopeptide (TPR) repeat protein
VVAAWLSRVNQAFGLRAAAAKSGAGALALVTATTSPTDRLFVDAVAAEAEGQTDVARARYRALVDRFPDEPAWLMEMAAFHERQRETAAAIDAYHKALDADSRLARPHLFLCRLYNSTGTNDAALAKQHGERARDAYRALGAQGGEAQALLCLVDILRVGDATQRAEARRLAAEALKIYEGLGWPFNVARAYHYSATAVGKDDIAAAAALWEKALTGARQVGNGSLEATVLANLGVQYHELGDPERALDFYRQSFQLNETRGDARGAAYSRANAGALMVQSGIEPDEGLRYLETALKVFTGVDSNFEMFCRQNLAEYYRHSGQLQLADRELNRAFDLANRHGFDDDVPGLLLERARLKAAQADYVTARSDLLQAIDKDAGPKAEMRIELGLVLTSLADFEPARQALTQAGEEIRRGSVRHLEPRLHAALGLLEYESGRWPEALTDFRRAHSLATRPSADPAILEARAYAAVIDVRDGRAASADAFGQSCVIQAQRMRRVALEARCRTLLARTALAAQRPGEGVKALADVRVEELGPELQAQVLYWRGRAATLSGDGAAGERQLAEARRLLTAVRELVPSTLREAYSQRPDIRLIVE